MVSTRPNGLLKKSESAWFLLLKMAMDPRFAVRLLSRYIEI